jgi:DNA topoisomerase-3
LRLVIAEKPSVARDLARVLGASQRRDGYLEGNGLRITWCVGHLVELEDPSHYDDAWRRWSFDTLPMVPESFALRPRKTATDQWKVVRTLLRGREIEDVVNACDAGREGELIFRYVYQLAGCRKPVLRLWVSSLTDQAIKQGWSRLRPGSQFDPLAAAARARSEADWLVGLNATRAMTCRTRDAGGDALWSVGRVQTPTLAMIVARDREIAAFVPETYWQVKAKLVAEPGDWQGVWFRDAPETKAKRDDGAPKGQRLGALADAEAVVAASVGRQGTVLRAHRKEKRERHPLLYDLTALQRRANQRFGFPAARTLEIAQALYEKHKVLTYPRTDARFLTQDQVPELPDVLRAVGGLRPYRPFTDVLLASPLRITKRIVDDSEVGDHHAIIPTSRTPSPAALSPDEKRIYDLVARRLMAALSPDAVLDLAELVVAVPPAEVALPDDVPVPLTFRAKGRVLREAGWRAVDPPKKTKDVHLPNVSVGDVVHVAEAKTEEGQTRPPRPHDDASLLDAMEKAGRQLDDAELKRALRGAGLGTPATRAAILTTLQSRDYVVRDRKALRATEKGFALIDTLPAGDLKSAELTGRWEKRLSDIAEGRGDARGFMTDVVAHVHGVVGDIATVEVPEAARQRTQPLGKAIGACPACGEPVRDRGKVFACDTGRSCAFVVFKSMSKRKISARMVRELLQEGRTAPVKGFKSKKGKPFTAGLEVGEDGKVGFWFPDRGEERAPRGPVGLSCPSCGSGRVLAGRAAWGCSRWREGCGWRLPFEQDGRRLSDADAVARIRG